MRYKTVLKANIDCDGNECFGGYAGERMYHCQHLVGVKDLDDDNPRLIKADDSYGSPFYRKTQEILTDLRCLCDKGMVWVEEDDMVDEWG